MSPGACAPAIVLCLSLAACGVESAHLCEEVDFGAQERCVTFHATGEFDPVDNFQIDVQYQDPRDATYRVTRIISPSADGYPHSPPIAFGLRFAQFQTPWNYRIVARLGTLPIAYAESGLNSVPQGVPSDRDVALETVLHNSCFDGVKEVGELATDCTGDDGSCPYCKPGDPCEHDGDCVDSTCFGATFEKKGVCVAIQ